MKYRALIDYGIYEGLVFIDGEFDNVDDAVRTAQADSYGSDFYIVRVIDWRAKETK